MFSETAGNLESYIHKFLQKCFNHPKELDSSKPAKEAKDFKIDDHIHDNKEQMAHDEQEKFQYSDQDNYDDYYQENYDNYERENYENYYQENYNNYDQEKYDKL